MSPVSDDRDTQTASVPEAPGAHPAMDGEATSRDRCATPGSRSSTGTSG
jgi:hypothetical protein